MNGLVGHTVNRFSMVGQGFLKRGGELKNMAILLYESKFENYKMHDNFL